MSTRFWPHLNAGKARLVWGTEPEGPVTVMSYASGATLGRLRKLMSESA